MRILYLSCHETLEFDEVSMFHEMGHEIFSPGAYVEPDNRGDGCLRPSIPGLVYNPDDVAAYHALGGLVPGKDGKEHLTKEFIDRFDVVIVMHIPRWIANNWGAMQHKRVVWRTIGQCLPHQEKAMQQYRAQGLKIVRYSPREEVLEGYAGCDAMIRFAKDPEIYRDWTGERQTVINFTQSMPKRAGHCNYDLYRQVMQGLPAELYGPENEAAGPIAKGRVSFDQQLALLKNSRAYFYAGTHPASYTLNFIESWLCGIPIVAIGPYHGNAPFHRRPPFIGAPDDDCLYEVARLIEHGVTGFVSDRVDELRDCCRQLLDNHTLAQNISTAARKIAGVHFGRPTIMERWRQFFETL